MKDFWDDRYRAPHYVYGVEPNIFFKQQLQQLKPGRILMAAEGEGRNGVYAATRGWQVDAFDQSIEGRNKALLLAQQHNVTINYQVGEFSSFRFEPESFDALALIYAHFSADTKSAYHRSLIQLLKPGGVVIFEAFSKNHLSYQEQFPQVGGPKDIGMLFSTEEVQSDFSGFDVNYLAEEVVHLEEGPNHSGTGSVIRFVGRRGKS